MNEQQKLKAARKLLNFLKKEIPVNQYDSDVLEVLMLACHACTSSNNFKQLISSGS